MEKIYDETMNIYINKHELIEFYKLAGNILEFFHQPTHFEDTELLNNFYSKNYEKLEKYHILFKENSELFRRNNGDYLISLSVNSIYKLRSCINLIYLIMKLDEFKSNIRYLYTPDDYQRWSYIYFHVIEHWISEELEDEIYPD